MISNHLIKRQKNRLDALLDSDEKIIKQREQLKKLADKIFLEIQIIVNRIKQQHPELTDYDKYSYHKRITNTKKILRKIPYYKVLSKQFDAVNRLTQKHMEKYKMFYIRQRLQKSIFDTSYFQSLVEKYGSHQMATIAKKNYI